MARHHHYVGTRIFDRDNRWVHWAGLVGRRGRQGEDAELTGAQPRDSRQQGAVARVGEEGSLTEEKADP